MEFCLESGLAIHTHAENRFPSQTASSRYPSPRRARQITPTFSCSRGYGQMARPLVGTGPWRLETEESFVACLASRRVARAQCPRRVGRNTGPHTRSILPFHQFADRACFGMRYADSHRRDIACGPGLVPGRHALLGGSGMDRGNPLAPSTRLVHRFQLAS